MTEAGGGDCMADAEGVDLGISRACSELMINPKAS
jgi:hypothetical protein